jgi:tetratricopeptide (TPR) repeat protein
LLILVTCAVFWPVCTFKFVDWDDYENVARNPAFNPLTVHGLIRFWQRPYLDLYVPVTYSGWGLICVPARLDAPEGPGIWLDSRWFHAANLLIHLASTLIAYHLLKALCRRRWPAWAGAMLFAIHPMQVEPVAWVTGMKDVLSGLFSVLSLWQYVLFAGRILPDQPETRRRRVHYWVATGALVLAILSKPSAITIPLAAAALDRLVLRRPWRTIAVALSPWFALAAGGAIITLIGQRSPVVDAGTADRPLLAAHALGFYLRQVVIPLRLMVAYGTPREILSYRWLPLTVLTPIAVVWAVWLLRRRAPWLVAATIVFVAGLLPVLGLVRFDFEQFSLVADRYVYIAMLGPALALAFLLTLGRWRAVIAAGCTVWLVFLAVRAGNRIYAWRDTATLFENELRANPNSALAYNKLAIEALHAGKLDEALRLANKAAALRPGESMAYITIGTVLRIRGNTEGARAMLERAWSVGRSDPVALVDLAGLLVEKKDFKRAAGLCEEALAIQPDAAPAHNCLATILAYQHQLGPALQEAQTAVQLDPMSPQMHLTLGLLLRDTNQPEAAAAEFEAVRRLSPR